MSDKKRILIIEDEPDFVTFLSALLNDNGYETLTAVDGEEGFRLAMEEKPDLITLDMTMPKQSGVRTFRDLKDDPELKEIPVVIITAIGDDMKSFLDQRRQIPEPEGFMTKPVDQAELIEMINRLLT